jgi:hypothetical protein
MSLSTRLDKLEAATRGRDGGDPPNGRWMCRLIYDPSERQINEDLPSGVTSDERSHGRSDTVASVLLASGWIICDELVVIFHRPKCRCVTVRAIS